MVRQKCSGIRRSYLVFLYIAQVQKQQGLTVVLLLMTKIHGYQ